MFNLEILGNHFKKMDWWLIGLAVSLTLFGLISIFSASFFSANFFNFKKQILFLGLGLILMIVFSFLDWKALKENPYLILSLYFLNLLALFLLFFLAPITKGIKGWYKIGPFAVDPAESLKIILIILLAKYFSMRHVEMYKITHILVSGIYGLPAFLLIFFQPDLGSALILLLLWLAILIISGIEVRHFLFLLLAVTLIFAFSWNRFLKEYQRERIISFLMPEVEPLGASWSQIQAKIAVGSGRIFGKGFRKGSQVQFGFLTAPQTDFIFSAIAEEFGLFGVSFLLCLLSSFFLRLISIAFSSRTNFPRLFTTGFAILFGLQVFIHIGMNLGFLPIIGISLPFVSYGGSGLVMNYLGLGILQSFKVNKE